MTPPGTAAVEGIDQSDLELVGIGVVALVALWLMYRGLTAPSAPRKNS